MSKAPKPKKPPTCTICGVVGHFSRDCIDVDAVPSSIRGGPSVPIYKTSFIDTHCHVDYMCERDHVPHWGAFLAQHPMPPNYEGCITTFCDPTAILSSGLSQRDDLLANHSTTVWHTFGIHPHNARYWNDRTRDVMFEHLTHPQCVGLGEIGIDITSEDKGGSEQQKQNEVLLAQLQMASMVEKPIVIHYRGEGDDLLQILRSTLPPHQKLHLHCWSCTRPEATAGMLSAFPNTYFGMTALSVEMAKMQPIIQNIIPRGKLLLESDAPYLLSKTLKAPKGSKQPINHPGFINLTAQTLSHVLGDGKGTAAVEALLGEIRQNTKTLYGI
eukprot:PhF_6_TR4401/c1_g1_i1/m.5946/K03424/tatD; TatD DNase family protein